MGLQEPPSDVHWDFQAQYGGGERDQKNTPHHWEAPPGPPLVTATEFKANEQN